ncbi:MAG: Acyl-protein synthetase (LuxE) domain-containing protein [Candidatus Methanolliviera sp. GoM_asphalt]|nr:MAG: Acyl-protein synthetase (LuxE) domain-containing protein [Candidatus Methanolliviera sp. GoM_asphalt]
MTNGKKALRNVIASLPCDRIMMKVLDMRYWYALRKNDYITQLCSHPKYGFMPIDGLKELQWRAVKQAFVHHYNDCKTYREHCLDAGIKPDDIHSYQDVMNIPQIPAEMFKRGGIISIPRSNIMSVVTTSGTTGDPSYLPRDVPSMINFAEEIIRLMINVYEPAAAYRTERTKKEIVKYALSNWAFDLFTPTPQETSTWLTQALAPVVPIAKMFGIDVEFYLKNFKFEPAKVLSVIKGRNKENKMMIFWAFHYIINEMMKYMDETGERLELDPTGNNICVMCLGGGWKTLEGDKVDKLEFMRMIKEHFGINEDWIFDVYGLGEVQFGALEVLCPEKRMHAVTQAPILATRDPDTLEIQDYGEEGLLSIWDPTMNAYPGFVISDDIVKITDIYECPACGRTAQDVKFIGRAEKAELRSCGLKTQQIFNDDSLELLEKFKMENVMKAGIGYKPGDELR